MSERGLAGAFPGAPTEVGLGDWRGAGPELCLTWGHLYSLAWSFPCVAPRVPVVGMEKTLLTLPLSPGP